MHKALGLIPCILQTVCVHVKNPSSWDVETGELSSVEHPQLLIESELG